MELLFYIYAHIFFSIIFFIYSSMASSQKKFLSKLFFLLLTIVSINAAFTNIGDPTIIEVSTSLSSFVAPSGSTEGGTLIYIKGTNFSPNAGDNVITVGPYPCLIPSADGARQNSLTCRTTRATNPNQVWGLAVSVKVGDVFVSCNSNNCAFTYTENLTPYIQEVIPRSVPGDGSVYIYGTHRITNLGDGRSTSGTDIDYFLIGERTCSLIDVIQNEDSFNPNGRSGIQCIADRTQQTGQYSFTQLVRPGLARLSLRTTQTSYFTEKNYTQRVLSQIKSLSSHQGGSKGQLLTVKGAGFSSKLNQYSCSIAGQTCQVTQASLTQVTVKVPEKSAGNTAFGQLTKNPSDSSTQVNGFLGSSGAIYKRYDREGMWKSTTTWFSDLRGAPTNTLVSQKIITELSSPQAYGQSYVQYVKGYFHAPTTGVYRFSATSDDAFEMLFSSTKNNANVNNLQRLLYQGGYNYNRYVAQVRANLTNVVNITLSSGYYYFEIININYGGTGFFKVSVDMPSLRQYTSNPTWQIDNIKIKPTEFDAEVIKVKVFGASGSFDLFYYDSLNYLKMASITIGMSASDFQDQLGNLPNIGGYNPSVALSTLDASGSVTLNSTQIQGYEYTITINRFRPTTPLPSSRTTNLVAGAVAKSVTVTRTVTHSPPLSGTFSLLANNTPIQIDNSPNIPFDVYTYKIQYALNKLYSSKQIKVSRVMDTQSQNSIEMIIEYLGIIGPIIPLTVDLTLLSGGKTGTRPAGKVQTLRWYSNRQLYTPIPYDFIYVAQSTPSLQLKVNRIPALCVDCSYQFNLAATPVISSAPRTGSTITVSLTNPSNLNFTLSDITVSFLEKQCINLAGTISSFTCSLPVNTDTTPALPAGTGTVKVHVSQIGFADNSGLTAQTISITATSMTPSQTSLSGGINGVIVGTGFPTTSDNLLLQLCGNNVTQFVSLTNTQLTFKVPKSVISCTGSNNVLSYGGQSTIFTFSYNAALGPQITSLSKTSSSPVLKSTIGIVGTNFGGTVKVFLVQNQTKKYELSVISVNSTNIQCVLGGGKSGIYDVIIEDPANGISSAGANSRFSYKIVITSLSISSGHKGGGYNLTINGLNFATAAGTNNVFIGDAKNSVCNVLQSTPTSIVCQVPRMLDQYSTNQALGVVVTGRIVEESVCEGTCSFTYLDAGASTINLPASAVYKFRDVVSVTGTGLSGAIVKINNIICSSTSNDTSVTFTYPEITAGFYEVFIMVSNGWTYPQFISQTIFSLDSGSISILSYEGGQFKVSGNGLPSIKKISAWLVCTSTIPLTVLSGTASQLYISLPKFSGDSACKVNVTSGTTFKLFSLTYSPNATCSMGISGSGLSYTLTKNNMTTNFTIGKAQFVWLDSSGNPTSSVYPMTISGSTISTSYLPAGQYQVKVHSNIYGFAFVTPSTISVSFPANPTATSVSTSFVGGKQMTISGAGFVTNNPANNEISVCGLPAKTISATQSGVTIEIPALVTTNTQALYSLAEDGELSGKAFGDTSSSQRIIDNSFNTLYTSRNSECFIGINFGDNTYADISQIRFVPNPSWAIAAVKLEGAVFEGSNNNINYTQIFTVDTSDAHSGWNTWKKTTGSHQYQYVRFRHSSLSLCQLAEIKVYGIKYSTLSVSNSSDKTCDILVKTGNKVISGAVTYSHSSTAVVSSITPAFGPSIGNEVIRIQGSGFGTGSTVTVTIDGIACVLANQTNTQIYCTTGRRATPPAAGNSFVVETNGNKAKIATKPYLYIDRWSNTATWGDEAVPREGDTVYVPKGMTLLVDESTPILYTVIIEGKIQFEDTKDLTFDTNYFVINGGQFEAGTETQRFQHKLTITLHGGFFDKQLPTLGNKVLGCRNCKFNMHGKERKTWTEVQTTIAPGATSFTVISPVDWIAGDKIAVAATSYDHYETEQKQISSVSGDGLTITVTTPFKYRHFAATQTFGAQNFVMRAEVGLLTRNIVVKGDDKSVDDQYGSHLMLTGNQASGLVGKISYAEFTKCGQPRIVGRYCTHFHMAGDVPDSYIRGIAVHHSFARVLTIHGTHFLLFEKSVGYFVKGHNVFVEDGIETNNVIQDNLMMSSITSNNLLQSDMTVASYWITNPYNTVRRNHAAGGDFYGFWYEIKDHPDGPSATSDICPMGMRLGVSKDNVAHSNRRFGLRIFKLSARKYPCIDTEDESAEDPYIGNPPILSVFENYTLWKNEECGFLGQELGYTTIRNFRTIDSRKGGLQFHKTNFTKQLVTAENCLVVGFSSGNAPADINTDYNNARGVIASRTDGLKFSGIRFYNFGATMTPLQSCSQCYHFKLWVTGGKTTFFENISYTNILGKYIFWQKWRREIFIDLDGTMSLPFKNSITPALPAQSKAVISPYRPSLMVPNHCYRDTNNSWDNSVYCDQTITLRGILFTNGIPAIDFNAIDIKANLMNGQSQNVTLQAQSQFSAQPMIIIKKSNDKKNSWAMPFATNSYYNVHWKWGIDFTHMAIAPSRLWDVNDGVVLRFNYSDARELFQIGKWYKQQLQLPFIVPNSTMINPTTCQNADYYHDPDNKYLYVCVSGRNKKIREWIDVNGIRCLNFCPPAIAVTQRQKFSRLWSNVTQWPNQTLPRQMENVTIPYQWNLVLDIDPPKLNYVQINGILIFDRARDNKFQAHYIWVKQGIIQIGSAQSPFNKKANIILHGSKNSTYMVVDPDASGNKMLAVTGGLQFYGIQPQTAWTRLTQTAVVNSTQINVISAAGWNVGDKIVIAPSYSGRKQFEQVTIQSISGNTVTFSPALSFEHYGAATTTIENTYGILDTRSAVGILTRNIKISPGPDPDNWGCRVLVYGYQQINDDLSILPIWRNGYAKLKGVEIDRCGQFDTTYAGLRIENIGANNNANNISTEIENSAIHGCVGFCTFIKQAENLHINNNVFFWARKFLVYVEEIIGKYNFTNNLLIGARKRDEITYLSDTNMVDDVAAYQQYIPIDFAANHQIIVSKNLVQGSEGQGFVFPSTTCDLISTYPFVDNTAGSCQVAFMYQKLDGKTCLAAKGCIGYASEIGLMANMPGSHQQVIYSNMFFADNKRGVTLRYAHEIDDNTIHFKDSYVTGISRLNCPTCYGANKIKYCSGGYGVRMFTATISGQKFPLKKHPTVHDVICTQQAFDFKAFINNVVFENYLHTNTQIPYCSNMAVFKRHSGASDGTASHHLTNSRCINCQTQSWAYFDQPSLGWRGWFGGCGELDCTGPNNYLIHDQDGTFTGQRSQILSNNSMIGDYQTFCQKVPQMNGHWCHTEELAVLQYESIAPDFNKRKMWPTYLKYDGGLWNSTTNGWKEWEWDGPQPMNLRLARFWSVIKLHENYNLTYESQPPSDSRFQIQKRLLPTGNPNDWMIIRIYYPLPNSIEVLVKNITGQDILVKPYPIKSGVSVDLRNNTSICGANNFYYEDGVIQFVVNGISNCQVRVRLSSYIQLSARIDIPISDFYSNNGITSFITNICAFLGIDTGRMKIVGVREGSTIVDSIIQTKAIDLDYSRNASEKHQNEYEQLDQLEKKLKEGLRKGSIPLGGTILDFTTNKYIFYTDGSQYKLEQRSPSNSNTLVIVLSILIPVLILGIIIGGYCYWKNKSRVENQAQVLNNKSTVQRSTIKGSTQFEMSEADELAVGKYNHKKWNDVTET